MSKFSRVLRGGSWNDLPNLLRAAFRDYRSPAYRYYNLCFRLILRKTS